MNGFNLFILALGLGAVDFLWQAITAKEWATAFERFYFQSTALLAAWLLWGI